MKIINFRRNLLLVILLGFFSFSSIGCSLFKIASSPFKSTPTAVPQKITKSKKKYKIRDKVKKISIDYYEENYNKEERKLTLKEKFLHFLTNLKGYLFWFVIISILLTATGFGWIVSAVWQSVFGLGRVLKATVRGISRAKRNGGEYMKELNYEHNKDRKIKRVINKYRADIENEGI